MFVLRGAPGVVSTAVGLAVVYPLHFEQVINGTHLDILLGTYSDAFVAAAASGVTRLAFDIATSPLLYSANKGIYGTRHKALDFGARYATFSLISRALEVASSTAMLAIFENKFNIPQGIAIPTNGKVTLGWVLPLETLLYDALVLHENPVPKMKLWAATAGRTIAHLQETAASAIKSAQSASYNAAKNIMKH